MDSNGLIPKTGAFNPYWYPPLESVWYDLVEDATISSTSGEVVLSTFTLPIASIGTIRWFGQRSSGSYDPITWKIRVNDGPDTVYGNIRGLISELHNPNDILVKVPRAGIIKLTVSSTSASPLTVTGRLKGWYWPEDCVRSPWR